MDEAVHPAHYPLAVGLDAMTSATDDAFHAAGPALVPAGPMAFFCNMAFFRGESGLGRKLLARLTALKEVMGDGFRIQFTVMDEGKCTIPEFDGKVRALTHTKTYLMATGRTFLSVVGSTNCKTNDFTEKANNCLLIREFKENPIFTCLARQQEGINESFLSILNFSTIESKI